MEHVAPKAVHKNTDGHLGEICNNCGGFGFTNTLSGTSTGCPHCLGSGVQPIDTHDLNAKLDNLTRIVEKLLENK